MPPLYRITAAKKAIDSNARKNISPGAVCPGRANMARFSAATYKTDASPCPFEVLTLRRYRPPQVAQVSLLDEAPAHIATAILKSKVIASAGPWRSSGDGWKQDPWDHSEWDIAVTGGALYRLHEDLRRGRWFLEGNYD
jgi:hypothetical protein